MLQIPQDIVLRFGAKPYILTDELRLVNIKNCTKNAEKLRKFCEKHKILDFCGIFVIMGAAIGKWVYLIVTI